MSTVFLIAIQEWRYWLRTKLGSTVAVMSLILVCISVFASLSQQAQERDTRESLQIQAEETFRDQPARHPHRMVHYGHYVFRAPPPLSIIDPGVDAFTGTSIFLEGHRQNSAMFADRQSSAGLAAFGGLTPAFLLQTLAPLLLILMGYNVITREREARTLEQLISQGVTPAHSLWGKGIALVKLIARAFALRVHV